MITPRMTEQLAARSGASETKIRSGMTGAVGSIVEGLAGKAGDPSAMGKVAEAIQQAPEVEGAPERLIDDDSPMRASGSKLLGMATNDPTGIAKKLSQTTGLGAGLSATLLGIASTVVMGAFRKFSRASGGLDARSLSSSLVEARDGMRTAVVGGAAKEVEVLPRDRRPVGATSAEARPVQRAEEHRGRGWWWLALVPIALILAWLFSRGRQKEIEPRPSTTPAKPTERSTQPRETAPSTAPQPESSRSSQESSSPSSGASSSSSNETSQTSQADHSDQIRRLESSGSVAQAPPAPMPGAPTSAPPPGTTPGEPPPAPTTPSTPTESAPEATGPESSPSTTMPGEGAPAEPGEPSGSAAPAPTPGEQAAPAPKPGEQTGSQAEPKTPGEQTGEQTAPSGTAPSSAAPSGTGTRGTSSQTSTSSQGQHSSASAQSYSSDSAEAKLFEQAREPAASRATWVELDRVTFDSGSAKLSENAKEQITGIAAVLEENPDVKIEVGGFADATGSSKVNQALSQKRANAVRQDLISEGIAPSRIQAKGYGSREKLEDTQSAAQANRRAAIRVIPKATQQSMKGSPRPTG
ncbi:MAG: OmpA family protein [Kofleriaceae bacterium]